MNPFIEMAHKAIELHSLIIKGNGDSIEAEQIKESAEKMLNELTDDQKRRIYQYSVGLELLRKELLRDDSWFWDTPPLKEEERKLFGL